MRSKFLNYKRHEVKDHVKTLLFVMYLLCTIFTLLYFAAKDHKETQENIMFCSMHLFSTTFLLTLCWLASQKNIRYIELSGVALCGTSCAIMAISNFCGLIEMNDKFNNQELCFALLFYVMYIGLLNTTFVN